MLRYDETAVGVPRKVFARALQAEGFPSSEGYVRPLYHLPVFQRRIAIGREGFPFDRAASHAAPHCPVAEDLHERRFLSFEPCAYEIDEARRDLLVEAIRKVYRNREALAALERK
jgi:hypothetical protein